MSKRPINISDVREKYSPEDWYGKVPLPIINAANSTLTDIRVYVALYFISGKFDGMWHGSQEQIFERYEERLIANGLGHLPYVAPSLSSINRSIQRLRKDKHIIVKRLGVKHHNTLQYYVVAKATDIPPIHQRD